MEIFPHVSRSLLALCLPGLRDSFLASLSVDSKHFRSDCERSAGHPMRVREGKGGAAVKISGDELVIPISDLINETTVAALCKQAVFSEICAEFVCKILVEGECNWSDEEAAGYFSAWRMYRTGSPQAFEKARQEVAKHSSEIIKKLVRDLTEHRDRLEVENRKLSADNFSYREANMRLSDENRQLRSALSIAESIP